MVVTKELKLRPEDYLDLCSDLVLEGGDWSLVGGQAVNLWAELAADKVQGLLKYHPYVSKDIDLIFQVADDFNRFESYLEEGMPPILDKPLLGELRDSIGEALRYMPGVPDFFLATGARCQFPGSWIAPNPGCLLKTKTWNAMNLPQGANTDTPRADFRHLAILSELLPAFLKNPPKGAQSSVFHAARCVRQILEHPDCLHFFQSKLDLGEEKLSALTDAACEVHPEPPQRTCYVSPILDDNAKEHLKSKLPGMEFATMHHSQIPDSFVCIDDVVHGKKIGEAVELELSNYLEPHLEKYKQAVDALGEPGAQLASTKRHARPFVSPTTQPEKITSWDFHR